MAKGLQAYGARFYDPSIGRFTGVDPISDKFAHLSTFNYASNDPVKNIDLYGLQGIRADLVFDEISGDPGLNSISATKAERVKFTQDAGLAFSAGAMLLTPGPEDVVLAGVASTLIGAKIIGALSKFGSEISGGVKGLFKGGNDTASALQNAANSASDAIGSGSGAVHGTKVHSAFAKQVDQIDGVTPEVSYSNGEVVPYGTKGSVRPDVVEGNIHNPTNIYDLKTGNAKVTTKDINKFKEHVPGSPTVKEIKPSGNE